MTQPGAPEASAPDLMDEVKAILERVLMVDSEDLVPDAELDGDLEAASIDFDDKAGLFYRGYGGKSNLVRLNGRPVLSTEELSHGDVIRIGETALRFVALCGNGFSWAAGSDTGAADGAAH